MNLLLLNMANDERPQENCDFMHTKKTKNQIPYANYKVSDNEIIIRCEKGMII